MQQRAKKIHYQSKELVCVTNNHVDEDDHLLIAHGLDTLTIILNFMSVVSIFRVAMTLILDLLLIPQ